MSVRHEEAVNWNRWDLFSILLLALAAVLVARWSQVSLGTEIYTKRFFDLWFSADQPRVLGNLTDPTYWDHRSYLHPLFKLAFYPITTLLNAVGLDAVKAAQHVVAVSVGIGVPLFYVALRGLRLPPFAALVFSGCLLASAAFIHWSAIVETYPFAFLSLMVMFAILTCADTRSTALWYAGSLFTITITVTNWSFGLASTFFRLRFRSFLIVAVLTFCSAVALGYFQQVAFKDAKLLLFFDPANLSREQQWTQPALQKSGMMQWNPAANLRSLLLYGAVAPPPEEISRKDSWHQYKAVDNQSVSAWQYTPLALVAVAAWIVLLTFGLWGAAKHKAGKPAFFALATFIVGQFAMHLVYGDVTFLYSLHFFPALLGIAAFGWFSPARMVSLAAALVFLVAGATSNLQQFCTATDIARTLVGNSPTADAIVVVTAGGDAYKGFPSFNLLADGQLIGSSDVTNAVDTTSGKRFDALGAGKGHYLERFVFAVPDILDTAAIEIEFLNDDWAGPDRLGDRNLFVAEVSVNTVEKHTDVSLVTTAIFDPKSLHPVVPDPRGARITANWAALYSTGKLRLERPMNGWTRNELGVPVRHKAKSDIVAAK